MRANVPNKQPAYSWYTTQECIAQKFDIEEEYPGCEHLFRCLLMAGDEGLKALLNKASVINGSTTRSEIAQLFIDISTTLKRANPNHAKKAQSSPFQSAIIPTWAEKEISNGFNQLTSLSSGPKFFIAD